MTTRIGPDTAIRVKGYQAGEAGKNRKPPAALGAPARKLWLEGYDAAKSASKGTG